MHAGFDGLSRACANVVDNVAGIADANSMETREARAPLTSAIRTSSGILHRVAFVVAAIVLVASPSNARAQTPVKSSVKPSSAQPATAATPPSAKPSRPASKGCKWEAASGAGLRVWVGRCDYGSRKIDFFFKGNQLMQRYSDGDAPEALIDVLDMQPNETQTAAMSRVFASHTDAKTRAKCVLAPYKNGGKPPAGAAYYTFQPNAAYAKVLAKNKNDEVPDPPCGDWGTMSDGIQYFEVWPASAARKILFVRIGQDTPLFDERTLELIQ